MPSNKAPKKRSADAENLPPATMNNPEIRNRLSQSFNDAQVAHSEAQRKTLLKSLKKYHDKVNTIVVTDNYFVKKKPLRGRRIL